MSDIKLEFIKLLKYPVVGVTVVVVVLTLGIDVGNIKRIGMDGVEFHQNNLITTSKTKTVETKDKKKVQVPDTSHELASVLKVTNYSDKPSVTGWAYLGTYEKGSWSQRVIEVPELILPVPGNTYIVSANSINVREGKPQFPFYALKDKVGFAEKEDLIKILELDSDVGHNRVWAKIEVYTRDHKS